MYIYVIYFLFYTYMHIFNVVTFLLIPICYYVSDEMKVFSIFKEKSPT